MKSIMKKTIKLFGVTALLAVVGLSFAACDTEGGPNVNIRGIARVGETVTASSEGGEFTGNFRWEFSAVGEQRDWGAWLFTPGMNTGATLQNMEIGSGAQGRFIRASRLTVGGDRIFSNVLGPIQAY